MPLHGLIESAMQSDNIKKVYSALRAVGDELNIPDEQWQQTVTDPLRADDTPVSWKRANPKKPEVKPKGTLRTERAREVVIFAPQCVVNSTLPVEQRLQDSWDADQQGPVPQSVDVEVPEKVPSAARDFTFGHLTVDKEAGTAPWIRATFHRGTQMPCIELKVDLGTSGQPRKGRVFIFGTNLTRAEGVLPIEMHTSRTPEIEEFVYDHMASPKTQREQPQLHRPELYKEILAKKVTCIDVKLLGGPNDTTDIENRPAKLKFAGQLSSSDLQRWAKNAIAVSVHMTEAERFLGLLYARSLRHFKIYYTYRHKAVQAEYPEHAHFCQFFQSVMLFANRLGHFWFFRQQTPEADWQSPDFPFGVMDPPRWTVTSWKGRKNIDGTDQVEDEEEEEMSLPEPAGWTSLDLPPVWAGGEEAKFFHCLGLTQEHRISMQVDSSRSKAENDTGFQRQFSAMMDSCRYAIDADGDADLGFGDDGSKVIGKGIYVPQLLFDTDLPGNWDANAHSRLISDETRAVFEKELKRFDLLSEEQRNFSLNCLAPANALTIGYGPPGSRKTTTIIATAQSALKAGFKVLVCTLTKGAKKQLIKAWEDASDLEVHQGRWCDWTGAHPKSGYQGLGSRTDVHKYDFDYRRAQMATLLAVRPESGGISKVAEDWKNALSNVLGG